MLLNRSKRLTAGLKESTWESFQLEAVAGGGFRIRTHHGGDWHAEQCHRNQQTVITAGKTASAAMDTGCRFHIALCGKEGNTAAALAHLLRPRPTSLRSFRSCATASAATGGTTLSIILFPSPTPPPP